MQSDALAAAWRALVPAGTAIEIMEYSAPASPEGADEEAAARVMGLERRQEFLTGRACARRALIDLGLAPVGIPVAADRGPVWPAGVVGSITHTTSPTGDWVVAAAARDTVLSAIGIDLELCAHVDLRAIDLVLTPTEREWLRTLPQPLRRDEVSRIWSSKEAAIKAARGVTELVSVEISLSMNSTEFRARKPGSAIAVGTANWDFQGRSLVTHGYALAVAFRSP